MCRPIEHRSVSCLPGDGGTPVRIPVLGPDSSLSALIIRRSDRHHPVLGEVDEIVTLAGRALTVCGRIDWLRPERIPPVWHPRLLPPGAGTAILNHIAQHATGPLRYRGPYPSAALFASLSTCFTTDGTLDAFIADAETHAVGGMETEPAVDFIATPFERTSHRAVCVQRRDGRVAAVFALGHRFEPGATSGRRLRASDGETLAVLEVAGTRLATIVSLDARGLPQSGPVAPSPLVGDHLGDEIPSAVAMALWAAARAAAPRLLRDPLAELAAQVPLVWADCGLRLAAMDQGTLGLHAAFPLGELDGAALMGELASAMIPVAHRAAQRYAEASAPDGAGS